MGTRQHFDDWRAQAVDRERESGNDRCPTCKGTGTTLKFISGNPQGSCALETCKTCKGKTTVRI